MAQTFRVAKFGDFIPENHKSGDLKIIRGIGEFSGNLVKKLLEIEKTLSMNGKCWCKSLDYGKCCVEVFKPTAANFMLTICYQLHTASLSYASRSQSSFFYVKLLRLNSAQLFCVQ